MTSGGVARPPVAAAAATTPSNQQTMTQHYGARSQRQSLPSGWMELMDAASNRRCYFHKTTSWMVFSKAEMLLKGPPVTPSPTPRMSSPATVGSPSTDLFLVSALAMAFFTPCSALLSQSYGKSIAQFWHIFAVFWDKVHLINAILLRQDPIIMADIN
jgi:hypothetical protein